MRVSLVRHGPTHARGLIGWSDVPADVSDRKALARLVVSNEVGVSVVPDNASARAFRNYQGRLNQQLAASSQRVVLVVAGLPWVLKGHLP